MKKLVEVIRIKQEVLEVEEKYQFMKEVTASSPQKVIEAVRQLIGDEDREVFLVLVLNTKNKVTAIHRCHIGAINASVAAPREIFKSAILNNGKSIIVAHNHPSFDPSPSMEDIAVSKRLEECGEILGIELLDHVIVGNEKGISLKEKGYF